MKIIFGQVNTRLEGKYDGKDEPLGHIFQRTIMWGEDLMLEWVHTFIHTLEGIPMNWYFETELRHGIENWDDLVKGFLMNFSFEDDYRYIDEALQVVRVNIFKTPTKPN